jgi:thiamine-phosphate pyrophosphorylase
MLGPLIVVTDRVQAARAGHKLVDVVAAAVDGGARTVLLREKDLDAESRRELAEALAAVLAPVGGTLLLSDTLGRHTSFVPAPKTRGEPRVFGARTGVSGKACHSIADLTAARDEGVDYAVFSPVWETPSKPGYGPPLGFDGLRAGCAAVPDLPVYALGGIVPGRVASCRDAGAAGVAVMGGIMWAVDPAKVVRTILEEWR